jgi:hypothetical protein
LKHFLNSEVTEVMEAGYRVIGKLQRLRKRWTWTLLALLSTCDRMSWYSGRHPCFVFQKFFLQCLLKNSIRTDHKTFLTHLGFVVPRIFDHLNKTPN